MSNKTAKEAVMAIGKALRAELETLNKTQDVFTPRETALEITKAIREQIDLYKSELAKMQSKEAPLEKALFGADKSQNVVGTNGKILNTGNLLPSSGNKFDVFKSFKNNKANDKSGVIGSTVGAGQGGAQFGLSPASVAAGRQKAALAPKPLAEPHKSPILTPKTIAKPVAEAIEAKKDAPTPQPAVAPSLPVKQEPTKLPLRDLKLKDSGKKEPVVTTAPIENPAAAHPTPTAMTPDRVKQLTAKPVVQPDKHDVAINDSFKQWVHENILHPQTATAPAAAPAKKAAPTKKTAPAAAPAKKATAAPKEKASVKSAPKKESPKKETKNKPAPKKAAPKAEVKAKPAKENKPKAKSAKVKVKPVKTEDKKEDKDKMDKGEETLDKATNGLPGTPDSAAEIADSTKTKKHKSVFGFLKKSTKGVLPDDKKEEVVGHPNGNEGLLKQDEPMEKATLGAKDTTSKMMTTHALGDAAKQAKNAKMPAQQQSTKMPSPAEHMDRANDLMHWMNPSNHFQKMDELWEKKKKAKDKK